MYYQTHIILSINYSTSGKLKPSKLYIAIHHWSWQRISISPKSVKHTLLCATTKHSTKHPSFRSFGFSKCADRFSFAASRIIVHVVCATTNKLQKKKKRRIVSNVAMDAVDLWKEKKKKEKRKRRIISALNLSVRDSKCSRGWKEKSMAIIDESYIFDSMEIHIKNKAAKLILTLNFKIKNFFFFSLHYILLIKKVKHFRGTW